MKLHKTLLSRHKNHNQSQIQTSFYTNKNAFLLLNRNDSSFLRKPMDRTLSKDYFQNSNKGNEWIVVFNMFGVISRGEGRPLCLLLILRLRLSLFCLPSCRRRIL